MYGFPYCVVLILGKLPDLSMASFDSAKNPDLSMTSFDSVKNAWEYPPCH